MKYIEKGNQPADLLQYSKTPGASFNGCPCKGIWRSTLIKEQGYLCGYTMKRIEDNPSTTKIAHIQARNGTAATDLNHKNVVLCCLGNKGNEKKDCYADTRQENRSLQYISPLHENCERLIKYLANGEITCDDRNVKDEIVDDPNREPKPYENSLLNLNHRHLVEGRIGVYNGVKCELDKTGTLVKGKPARDWRKQDIEHWLKVYSEKDANGKFKEYCNFVIYRLKKELAWRTIRTR